MLTDDDDDFYETAAQFKQKVIKEIARWEKHLSAGGAINYEEYKFITGKIWGLKHCLELFVKKKVKG